jgi:pimeloyl-ACP methyl ester carboxylesterase
VSERRRPGRVAFAAAIGVLGIAITSAIGLAALASVVARKVITPPRKREYDIHILGLTASTITLTATVDTLTPGRYGLWFDNDEGHLRIGQILRTGEGTVTRELLAVDRGKLDLGDRARFSGWFYLHPSELGVPVEDVLIETEVGLAPAWLVPAEQGTDDWVIQVHGRGATRAEPIRAVPAFRAAGYSSLLISYRNDAVAPDSPDGVYSLGATEWRDVEAAIDLAVARGAKNIIVMGWSMGGAISLQTVLRTAHRELLRGLVLESAVVDWRSVLDFQAELENIPLILRRGALELLEQAWAKPLTGQHQPIDLEQFNLVARADELTAPTLVLHSADEGFVPIDAARELAALRPDLVRFEEFRVARHAKLWNYDQERFERVISEWLRGLAAPTARTGRSRRRAAAASE